MSSNDIVKFLYEDLLLPDDTYRLINAFLTSKKAKKKKVARLRCHNTERPCVEYIRAPRDCQGLHPPLD